MRSLQLSLVIAAVVLAQGLRAQTLNTLTTIPGAINGTVYSIVLDDSNVYVGGSFDSIGSLKVNHIARWDGSAWHTLGPDTSPGVSGVVRAMVVDSLHTVWVGGKFSTAGAIPCSNIARFANGRWDSLAGGVDDTVFALYLKDTEVWLGGAFERADTMRMRFLAKWIGHWDHVFPGDFNNTIRHIFLLDGYPDPRMVVMSGDFSAYDEPNRHVSALYNAWADTSVETSYLNYNGPMVGYYYPHRSDQPHSPPPGCNLLFGRFYESGTKHYGIDYRSNCNSLYTWGLWKEYPNGFVNVCATLDSCRFVIAGEFVNINGNPLFNLAYFDGADYVEMPEPCKIPVYALASDTYSFYYSGAPNIDESPHLMRFERAHNNIHYHASASSSDDRFYHYLNLFIRNESTSTASLHFSVATMDFPGFQGVNDGGSFWLAPGETASPTLFYMKNGSSGDGPFFIMSNGVEDIINEVDQEFPSANESIRVHPNPCRSGSNLTLANISDQASIVQITDDLGRLIASITIPQGVSDFKWDTSNLSPGLYFVRQGIHTYPLIIEH